MNVDYDFIKSVDLRISRIAKGYLTQKYKIYNRKLFSIDTKEDAWYLRRSKMPPIVLLSTLLRKNKNT